MPDAKEKASAEKVENVVKPPQNPTISKAFNLGVRSPCLDKSPVISPKIRQPNIFTVKVAAGKGAFQYTRKRRLNKNLQQVPIKPPAPAINISLNISIDYRSDFS